MNIGLSFEQIEKISQNKCFLVRASDKNIMYEIMEQEDSPYINFVIHYQTSHNEDLIDGHWVGMVVDRTTHNIYYFDSYGNFPDDDLNEIDKKYRIQTGQNQRDVGIFMAEMNSNLGYILNYSNDKFQKLEDGINTCGRWVGSFIYFINQGYNDEQFYDFIDFSMQENSCNDPDRLMCILTDNFIL